MRFDAPDVASDPGRCTTWLTQFPVIEVYRVLNRFPVFIPGPCAVLQVVELISGGAQIAVTNENKMHYLNLLAQYRLATQVRDEVEHFLKGKESPSDG